MRINVYWRGFDLIDIEAHAFRRRPDDEGDEAPKLQAVGYLADSTRAEPMDAPDTTAFGFAKPPDGPVR